MFDVLDTSGYWLNILHVLFIFNFTIHNYVAIVKNISFLYNFFFSRHIIMTVEMICITITEMYIDVLNYVIIKLYFKFSFVTVGTIILCIT